MRNLKILLATISMVLVCISINAYDFEVDGIYYNITSSEDKTIAVTYNESPLSAKYSGDIIIPAEIIYNGIVYSVTSIESKAFYECTELLSVSIPNSVTIIESAVFSGCSGLVSINIPDKVARIEDNTFYGCSNLISLNIPTNATKIGNAFFGCSNLTSIIIPKSVVDISQGAFSGCTALTSITVEDGNSVYNSHESCNAIIETETNTLHTGCKTTTIPNDVTRIGNSAFSYCQDLTSIIIPQGITSIGQGAFKGCNKLVSIKIPYNVTDIGHAAFQDCSSLIDVQVDNKTPVSLTEYTFTSRLKATLHVPKGCFTAYWSASFWKDFKNIVEMDCIEFADAKVKELCVANWDTNGDGELSKEEAAVVSDLGSVFKNNKVITSFNELQYFTGLSLIGDYSFANCSNLGCLTIPKNVTALGDYIIMGCSNLTNLEISEENTVFDSRNNSNAIIETATNKLAFGCAKTVIPNTVISIGKGAFRNCNFTSITIPNSVREINDYAFSLCIERPLNNYKQ